MAGQNPYCNVALGLALTLSAGSHSLAGGGADDPNTPPEKMPDIVLGVTETGTTVGAVDDIEIGCPHLGSKSGDVFYDFTPLKNMTINADLCASDYDTKTYIFDSAFNLIVCNDDACGSDGSRSSVNATLAAGERYIIAIDGDDGETGAYALTVTDATPSCDCPPGVIDEGEPCAESSVDTINGGCNSDPPVFSPIEPGDTYCGLTYFDGAIRDTDWFSYTSTVPAIYTWEGVANFPDFLVARMITNGIESCSGVGEFKFLLQQSPCTLASITSPVLDEGFQVWFAAPGFTNVLSCAAGPHQYYMTLSAEFFCDVTADLDGDDDVDFDDFTLLLANFGNTCP